MFSSFAIEEAMKVIAMERTQVPKLEQGLRRQLLVVLHLDFVLKLSLDPSLILSWELWEG